MLNDTIKSYWEGEAKGYSEGIKEELNSPLRDSWKKLVLENAPVGEHLEILDVGTGPGFFPIVLGEAGHHVTGIDITENMIAEAGENVRTAHQKARLMTMDCQDLKFENDSFDMVICRNLTWTLDDPEKAYREWFRVLKKGGRLLVFDASWYIHLFDEEKGRVYAEHEARMWKKYGRSVHNHKDAATGEDLSRKLFMSDKNRPLWDLEYMMSLGFAKVFAQPDISDLTREGMQKELNQLTPQFLVGAEK